MGARGCLLLALLLQRAASPEHEPVTEVTGTVGKSVTFRIPGPMEGRLYWHVKNLLMVIVNSSGYPEVLDAKYAERMAFLHNGTALILSGLVPDDAGTYWGQVATKRRYIFNLRVYAELPPPAVSCSLPNCTAAPCPYELLCSAPGAAVAYGWSGAGALNASGPRLQLRRPLRRLPPVTCTASNPVSSSNVTVQPAAACAEDSSRAPVSGLSRIIYIVIAVVLVAVLLSVAGTCWFCHSQFNLSWPVRPGPGTDPEALTVYASVGAAKQPAPQDPAQAAKAPEETSKTIYSTVQPAAQRQRDEEKTGGPAAGERSLYATVNAVPAPHGSMGLL